jgi:hypothetical protein
MLSLRTAPWNAEIRRLRGGYPTFHGSAVGRRALMPLDNGEIAAIDAWWRAAQFLTLVGDRRTRVNVPDSGRGRPPNQRLA